MTTLQRYRCDWCKNEYNGAPAATHTIDGDECDVCEECEREFQRVTDYPDRAEGLGYQYHGIYFPKSVAGESVWRHLDIINDRYHGLAEWVLIDHMLLAYHSDFLAVCSDEFDEENDGYQELSKEARNSVQTDDSFNRER